MEASPLLKSNEATVITTGQTIAAKKKNLLTRVVREDAKTSLS